MRAPPIILASWALVLAAGCTGSRGYVRGGPAEPREPAPARAEARWTHVDPYESPTAGISGTDEVAGTEGVASTAYVTRTVVVTPPPTTYVTYSVASSHVHGAGCGHTYWNGCWQACPPPAASLYYRPSWVYTGACATPVYVRPRPVVVAPPPCAPRPTIRTTPTLGASVGVPVGGRR